MMLKCKMCGGNIEVSGNQSICTCDYCGSSQTIPNSNDDKLVVLYNRANALRQKNEFDKALVAYQLIITDYPKEAEAYWGICLCKYGIEYVDDAGTKLKIPTCHRTLFTSIFDDDDYKQAIQNSNADAKSLYEKEAAEIDRMQKNIIKLSQKEDPYDIFICYKETDENGNRTTDSVYGQDLYDKLTSRGYKVFFARISLESKLGREYEPIIFSALRSSKVMLALGTKEEYFNAVWVKNEWSRFLEFMKNDKNKYLIPCYKDINAYEMPDEFLSLQAQDMSKIGYEQDLIRGLDKIFGRTLENNNLISEEKQLLEYYDKIDVALKSGDFVKAEWIIELIFEKNPKAAKGHFYKILINQKIKSIDELIKRKILLEKDSNYQNALKYASQQYKLELIALEDKIKTAINEDKYQHAEKLFNLKSFQEAKNIYSEITHYKDSRQKINNCNENIKEEEYLLGLENFNKKNFDVAMQTFINLGNYKNSEQMVSDIKYEKIIHTIEKDISISILQLNKIKFDIEIKKLEQIKHYGSVADLIENYKNEYEKTKKKSDETIKKQKIKKRITLVSLFSVVVFVVLLFVWIIPSTKYSKAMEYVQDKNYSQAISIFNQINYKDSKQQITLIDAMQSFNRNDYKSAIKYICSVGGTVNIVYDSGIGISSKNHDTINNFFNFEPATWTSNGYVLDSWQVLDYNVNNGDDDYITDLTLYPVYTLGQYIIHIYSSGDTNQVDRTISYNLESRIEIENPTKEGYEFIGWSGTSSENPVKDLIIEKGSYGDLNLVAIYEPIKYNINYHLDGGETTNPTQYTIEDTIRLSNAIKEGYSFNGWYTSDFSSIEEITNKTGDIELYAKFVVNTYNYHLDANGGVLTNPVQSVNVTYWYDDSHNETITLSNGEYVPFALYEKARSRIIGWYTDETLAFPFNFNTPINEDLDLYAKWETFNYPLLSSVSGDYNSYNWVYSNSLDTRRSESGYYVADVDCTVTLYASKNSGNTLLQVFIKNVTTGESKSNSEFFSSTTVSVSAREGDIIYCSISAYIRTEGLSGNYMISGCSAKEYYTSSYVNLPIELNTYDMSIVYGSSVLLPTPRKDGYTFIGWKCGDILITELNIDFWNVAQSNSIIAVWEENK